MNQAPADIDRATPCYYEPSEALAKPPEDRRLVNICVWNGTMYRSHGLAYLSEYPTIGDVLTLPVEFTGGVELPLRVKTVDMLKRDGLYLIPNHETPLWIYLEPVEADRNA